MLVFTSPTPECLGLQSEGEAGAAVEVQWRTAALDALQAYIVGPLMAATPPEQARLQRTLAQLLAPTLEAITSQSVLQVHTLCFKSLKSSVAASIAAGLCSEK